MVILFIISVDKDIVLININKDIKIFGKHLINVFLKAY